MKRVLILCAVVVLTSLSAFAQAPAPRVGIISDAGARKEADLLMVELQKAKCELVERDEIQKVLGEQTLHNLLSREGSQRIGRMLKADGLVVLTSSKPGQASFQHAVIEGSTRLLTSATNQTLTVRLVAVAPGVLTYLAEAPADAPGWAASTAAALTDYFPKLAVKADTATPVSLLRIRPTNGFASSIQLASELSPLLWQRLAKEPALFILDRENLPRVVEEAQWNGQEPGFWAGSVMVEGWSCQDLANTNQAFLTLTVQRPVAGTNTFTRAEWTETGALTDLPGLVERASARLRQEIGSRINNVPWDPQAEGRRLLSIAASLVDPRQQKAVIGTAMALGCRDKRAANEYRSALRSIAYRDAVRFANLTLHLAPGAELAEQARDFLELIRFHNDYRPPGGWNPNYKTNWHTSEEAEWMSAYFPPLQDIELFLASVKRAGRDNEIRSLIAEIQAACRETEERMRQMKHPQVQTTAVLDDAARSELARRQAPPVPPPPPAPTPPIPTPNPLIVSNASLLPVATKGTPGQIIAARWHTGHFQILWGELFCDVDLATRASEQFRLPPPGAVPGRIKQARWLGDKLLLIRAADHLLVDVPGRACQVIPPPLAASAPGPADWRPMEVAGEDALACVKTNSLGPDADYPGTSFAWRLMAEHDWHTTPLAFQIRSVAYVAGKFYFTTGSPRLVTYQSVGVIEFDPSTGQSVTLRTPGSPLERRGKGDAGKPLTFAHLQFEYGAQDGLLLGLIGQRLYGWDPVTKSVRDMNLLLNPEGGPTRRFDPISSGFGFELEYEAAAGTPSLARSALTATTHELSVRRVGRKKAAESVPLAFPEPDSVQGVVYPGRTSLLVPCRSRYAFYEIPYADIQQWLAANPPAADKPAPGVSPTTSVVPAPKGSTR